MAKALGGSPAALLGTDHPPPYRLHGDLGADLVLVGAGAGTGAGAVAPPGAALGAHVGRFVSHVAVAPSLLPIARGVLEAALPPDDVLVDPTTGAVLFVDADGNAIEVCAANE